MSEEQDQELRSKLDQIRQWPKLRFSKVEQPDEWPKVETVTAIEAMKELNRRGEEITALQNRVDGLDINLKAANLNIYSLRILLAESKKEREALEEHLKAANDKIKALEQTIEKMIKTTVGEGRNENRGTYPQGRD